jgi:hypothetical protein
MLKEIFHQLDVWVTDENIYASQNGYRSFPKCEFKIVGQAALMEAMLKIEFAATVDVDAMTNASYEVIAKFDQLLKANGLELDPLSGEIWMPAETIYVDLYEGAWVLAQRAEPEYIMVSKAVKAPQKNKILLGRYIAARPPQQFFKLCEKYNVNLAEILRI